MNCLKIHKAYAFESSTKSISVFILEDLFKRISERPKDKYDDDEEFL